MGRKQKTEPTDKDREVLRSGRRLTDKETADFEARGILPTAEEDEEVVREFEEEFPELKAGEMKRKTKERRLEEAVRDGRGSSIEDLPALLRAARRMKQIRLEEMERATGIGNANLSKLERGKGNPTIDTIQRMAKALGLQVIVTVEDIPAPPDVQIVSQAKELLGRMEEMAQAGEVKSPKFAELAHKLEQLAN